MMRRTDDTFTVKAQGTEAEPVLVSRYGEGVQPEFLGSSDGTRPGFWTPSGDGLWTANVSGKTDVGNIVRVAKGSSPDAPTCGWKRWRREDLRNEGDCFHDLDASRIWYRSTVELA